MGLLKGVSIQSLRSFGRSLSHFPGGRHFYLLILAVVLGVFGGFGAIVFRELIHLVQLLSYGMTEVSWSSAASLFRTNVSVSPLGYVFFEKTVPLWQLIGLPAAAALLIGPVVWRYVEESRGAGVPELLEAMTLRQGRIRWQVLPAKLFTSSISIGTIASLGREGPIVQIGASMGSIVNRVLKVPRRRWRLLTACGGAAGLAATFNTPIAGAFFMLEVVLGSFSTEKFAPIVISSVTGTIVGHWYFGESPAFDLAEKFQLVHPLELSGYVILGVIVGGFALFFIFLIDWTNVVFDRIPGPKSLRPLFGTGLLLILGLTFFPQVVGLGYETIEHLIGATTTNTPDGFLSRGVFFLLLLLLAKTLATAISLGAGFSGGVFSPSLFLGAALGYVVGMGTKAVLPIPVAPPEAYAVVGMGALFAGAGQAPVTAMIIIFEMTHDYEIILPLMISCSISTVMTRLLADESIYTTKLKQKGIDIHQRPEELIMNRVTAEEVMRSGEEEPLLRPDSPLDEITEDFLKHRVDHLFVVDDRRHVKGIVSLHEVKSVFSETEELGTLVRAVDVMDPDVPVLNRDTSLSEAMSLFWSTDYEELPVVESPEQPEFCGVVWEHDIIGVYNREVFKQREALMKTVHEDQGQEETDYVELPSDYKVDQLRVNPDWEGRTIGELHIRERTRITVLEVKRSANTGEWERIPANAETELQEGDRLIVYGPSDEIEKEQEGDRKS